MVTSTLPKTIVASSYSRLFIAILLCLPLGLRSQNSRTTNQFKVNTANAKSLVTAKSTTTANLIHNFEFAGNFNDSQPTGKVLQQPVSSTNSFSTNPNQWNWTATQAPGGGLFFSTDNLPNPESYTLAIDFSFAQTSSRRKILSFGSIYDDKGYYFYNSSILGMDNSVNLLGQLLPSTFYKLIITRAANDELKTYIIRPNGNLELINTHTDANKYAVPINSTQNLRDFTFFLDDNSTNFDYTTSGSVRLIKIWDGPLTSTELATAFLPSFVATTLEPINITSTSATVYGEANPNATNATFSFEYGTSTAYGQTISASPATNNGNVSIPISANLTGLQPSTTYHYRLKASNSTEDVFGDDKTFTTPINTFTSIVEASTVTTPGQYAINLNGNLFITTVDANGWVLIANDVGAPVSQSLQNVLTLDTNTRGILNTVTLANLGDINRLKVRASNGLLDVRSLNSTLISRVKLGQTLHGGLADNGINNSWTGVGAISVTGDATCNTTRGNNLKDNIFHTCGNVNGIVWIPSVGERMIVFNDDNVADNVSFGLWVKSEPLLNPGGVSGANLWLKSNEGVTNSGSNLTAWTDQTETNTFTKQGTIGYNTNAINFNPTASFTHDASTNVEPINRLNGNTAIDIGQAFAVYRNFTTTNKRNTSLLSNLNFTSLGSKRGIFQSNNLSPDYIYFENANIFFAYKAFPSNIGYDKFAIQTIDYSPTTAPFANAWSNGENNLVEPAGGAQVDYTVLSSVTPLIGGYHSPFNYNFNGELAEIITFPSGLSALDRKKVESYLAVKYGITLNNSVTDYVSSSGTSIWSNTTYWHDVFGIGKDDLSALNQTQSNSINTGSGDGTGQSGRGNIVLSNPSSLDDGDFLMIGHNNGGFTEQITDLPSSLTGKKRIAREWKVQQSGSVGAVSLTFNTLGLALTGTNASDYSLLIDNDGDGDFSTGSVTEVTAISLVGDIAIFSNATLSNNAVFTFATGNIPTTLDNALANVTLYPNPTKGNIQINLGQFASQTIITVFDVTGSKVSEDTFSSTNIIHLNILGGSGIYFIELNVEGLKHKFKVVKL